LEALVLKELLLKHSTLLTDLRHMPHMFGEGHGAEVCRKRDPRCETQTTSAPLM
jgi:endonuclease III